ncbi:MAG: anaerobic ribonucleoside-triphosphate reductase activating protein [Eubacterium sp.]|nr:anaerobic ribonucleoside-triphosphate reductase activating protein [Eubacterium sp.]
MASLRINALLEESIVDGPGLRFVVFTQGCPHHCPGCHNPQTHDPKAGQLIDIDAIASAIEENPLLQGVTFSGGEPFMQPAALTELGQKIHALGLDVVTYTGFTLEALRAKGNPEIDALLSVTDLLVDGPFLLEERNTTLAYRGSANQRLIPLSEAMQGLLPPEA